MRQRKTRMLTLRLDVAEDADLIAWLASLPRGRRSQVIRAALREHLRQAEGAGRGADLETIRAVVAEELASALSGLQWQAPVQDDVLGAADVERQFGSRLDRMMGGLAANSDPGEDESP